LCCGGGWRDFMLWGAFGSGSIPVTAELPRTPGATGCGGLSALDPANFGAGAGATTGAGAVTTGAFSISVSSLGFTSVSGLETHLLHALLLCSSAKPSLKLNSGMWASSITSLVSPSLPAPPISCGLNLRMSPSVQSAKLSDFPTGMSHSTLSPFQSPSPSSCSP